MVHTTHPISAHRIWKVRLRILRLLVTSNPFLHLCMGSERTRLSEAIHAFRMRRPVGKLGFPYSSVSLKTDSHLRDQQDKRERKSSSIEDVSLEFPNRHSHTEQRDWIVRKAMSGKVSDLHLSAIVNWSWRRTPPDRVHHAILYESSVGSSLFLLRGLTLSWLRMWNKEKTTDAVTND